MLAENGDALWKYFNSLTSFVSKYNYKYRYFLIQLVNSYLVLQYSIQSLIYKEMLLLHLFYLFQIHECWGSRGGLILELKSCMKFDYSMLKKTFFWYISNNLNSWMFHSSFNNTMQLFFLPQQEMKFSAHIRKSGAKSLVFIHLCKKMFSI